LLCVALLLSDGAQAEPQGNASLTIGPAAVGEAGTFWDHAEMHLGLRGDVLFGRTDASDFGAGPYVDVGTFAFDELQFGGGGELLLPVHTYFPFVISGGIYGRIGDDDYGLEPGVCAGLFWGSRSYNFHANYVMVGGLLLGYRYGFGESRESSLLIALQGDLAFIGLPFVMLADAIRGPSDEAAPIEPMR
jgi:hypothetical protein